MGGIWVQRDTVWRTGYVAIEILVKDKDITSAHSRKIMGIQKGVSALLVIQPSLVEVLRPTLGVQGMIVRLNVAVSHTRSVEMNIDNLIRDAVLNGHMAEMIHGAWNLQNMPLVEVLRVERHESKQRRQGGVQLEVVKQRVGSMSSVASESADLFD